MRKYILLVVAMVLIIAVGGCTKDTKDTDIYSKAEIVKKVEDDIQMKWLEKPKYKLDGRYYVIDGTIVKTTTVRIGDLTRVTVFGVEWISGDKKAEGVGDVEMGHTDLIERYFVKVVEFNGAGQELRSKRY